MARFSDQFLDEIRKALRISDVVRRRIPALKREGSEWKCLSPFNKEKTPSFTVNDQKGFFHDFSSGQHGDVIAFEMKVGGSTFVQAVRDLAAMAGLQVPGDKESPIQRPAPREEDDGRDHPNAPRQEVKREITTTYDYTDADGGLIYQVCRVLVTDAKGSHKTFLQRRRPPGSPGGWLWGLDAGTYVQGKNGDWYRLTEARERWQGKRLQVDDEVAHGLYRFAALREEMAQPEEERRLVLSPEGERDCDTLAAWGLLATDSSGGSNKWTDAHAEELRGADVVVLADNDKTGREYAHRKAASLRSIARRVRVLDWRDRWVSCPDGGDVTDWCASGGDRDKLMAVVDKLPDWTPVPPESAFNAIRYVDIDKPARELEWLIKNVMTRGECSIWFGPPSCGKSFLITDAALSIARGVSWFGMRVRPGLVVYQAGEGGLGLKRRLRAYRQHHKLKYGDDIPFVLLPSRIDIFSSDADVDKLITEIKAWAAFYDAPLELVVLDTLSAASPGANENASEDMTKVLGRAHKIAIETGAHVAIVHHTPKAGGTPRGHSLLHGNVENMVEVIRHEQVEAELRPDGSRIMRDVREWVCRKQKDGEDGFARRFVLKQVILGQDVDGDPMTSCIIEEIAGGVGSAGPKVVPRGYSNLAPNNVVLMRALVRAINEKGEAIPAEAKVDSGARCVKIGDWIAALMDVRFTSDPDDPDGKRLRARCKKAVERACGEYRWADRDGLNLIVKWKEYVWRSSRKVNGVDAPPQQSLPGMDVPISLLGEDEAPEDLADLLAP